MYAWVSHTSAETHGCPLHQEPLDLLLGVFQVQTLRHKIQRLERVVFVRSLLYLHNCPKRAPCSNLCRLEALTLKVDSKWFQHLGGLNSLMLCHEQRKARNLTARFKASTPLRLPHLHIPRRSVYQEGAVAASTSRWWKEHRRIHANLAGIPSV